MTKEEFIITKMHREAIREDIITSIMILGDVVLVSHECFDFGALLYMGWTILQFGYSLYKEVEFRLHFKKYMVDNK